jgi:hypothetical protein
MSGARENRAFLGRAVRYLVEEAGIRQFLDIGSGLPTASNVHEVAQSVAPETRVVYVANNRCKSGCARALSASRASPDPAGQRQTKAPRDRWTVTGPQPQSW